MDEKGRKTENPFHSMDKLISEITSLSDLIVVDFHAEVTSEKMALGWYLDGRVSAVVGTHTHVQTADERILPKGTAYISDLGMTGSHDSVIGLEKNVAINRFLTGKKVKFEVAKFGVFLDGVIIDVDERTGRASSIMRIQERAS